MISINEPNIPKSHLIARSYTITLTTVNYPIFHCHITGPVQNHRNPKRPQPAGHMNNTVCLLAGGYVATATRAPQNPAVTTGAPTAAHQVPIIRTFQRNVGLFASRSPAAGSVSQTSHSFHTDLQGGARRGGGRRREDPLSLEKLSKNIRSHCPICCFTANSEVQ